MGKLVYVTQPEKWGRVMCHLIRSLSRNDTLLLDRYNLVQKASVKITEYPQPN
jgi:hypothetical protein